MDHVLISKNILQHRQLAGLTQEQLANRLGVTKAAVSKWENGQSLPDILLLPKLASFFNTSIDELIGYSRQLTSPQIQRIYKLLSESFASSPIDEALATCDGYIKDYYHCYPLLTKICGLYLNHLEFITNPKQREDIIANIILIAKHVKKHSDDVNLLQEIKSLLTLTYIMSQQPEQALEQIGELDLILPPDSGLRAQCYSLLGETSKAQKTLQIGIYQHLLMLVQLLSDYTPHVLHNEQQFEQVYQRLLQLINIFELSELHPNTTARVHYSASLCYMQLGKPELAFNALSQCVYDIKHHLFPLELKGDAFFTYIVEWFHEVNIPTHAPRDILIVKQSVLQMLRHPAFSPFFEKAEYKQWLHDLNQL